MNSKLEQIWERILSRVRYLTIYLRHVAWRFVDDGCQTSAASLTYLTLFAVVPMMTVMYSVFAMIPSFQGIGNQVRDLVFANFIPSAGSDIQEYLVEFSDKARRLGPIGAVILFVTSYLMLSNIEKSFNRIWAVPGKRLGISSFLLYWAVLSLGPLLIGAALMMNTYVLSLQLLEIEYLQIGAGLRFLLEYLPWILTAMAFTLLYKAVPNCQVPLRNALLGGLAATLFFELAKSLFSELVSHTSYSDIYGAFAILPLFLIWVYLCWMIILAGAEFVRALETFSVQLRGRDYSQFMGALIALWRLWQAQKRGESLGDFDIIRSGVNATRWRELREKLQEQRIIVQTESGRFLLARDLDDITAWDLIELGDENFTRRPADSPGIVASYPWYEAVDASLKAVAGSARDELKQPLSALFGARVRDSKEEGGGNGK